jgi:hypothetical protein
VASVLKVSVSTSAALRGTKNFRVNTSFWEMFKEGDVLFYTATLFEVPSVSLMARRCRFRTSWKISSYVVCCPVALVNYFGVLGCYP